MNKHLKKAHKPWNLNEAGKGEFTMEKYALLESLRLSQRNEEGVPDEATALKQS